MVALEPLVLVGAGGFAREAVEVVAAINAVAPTWDLRGFADDDTRRHGECVKGLPVLGSPAAVSTELPQARLLVCCGSPRDWAVRRRLVERLGVEDARYAVLVHPGAHVAPSVEVGSGSVVLASAVATADASVGRHVIVMPHVVITHDDEVGAFSTLAARAALAGGVVLEEEVYLGAGALVGEGVRVGRRSLVGMGAVVRHDVPAGEVWVGNPARKLRDVLYSPPEDQTGP